MQAGLLRHVITIQEQVDDVNSVYGNVNKKRAVDFATVRARIEPVTGKEVAYAERVLTETTHKLTIRYLPGLSSEMRIIFYDARQQSTRYFRILGITNFEERCIYQTIFCLERATAD
jgi:SPP1 family predicted phage head-tail adaptor